MHFENCEAAGGIHGQKCRGLWCLIYILATLRLHCVSLEIQNCIHSKIPKDVGEWIAANKNVEIVLNGVKHYQWASVSRPTHCFCCVSLSVVVAASKCIEHTHLNTGMPVFVCVLLPRTQRPTSFRTLQD
jgi:hypothetical protein